MAVHSDLPRRLLPVLAELLEGKSNREIATNLSLTEHTVEKYVSNLLTIFECRSRGHLIAVASQKVGRTGEVSG
ncbi:MAG: helix-turn-helix transcriptional regulator [Dehalococcoidia bacterium]|jgi:DNA-binding NarL/FixJ family response regulator|nr:helix-turn-helix transcriptional regulator [Dehalococcoidia bacterium]MBK9344039.1 helix-turn-helix transcriptional regulator [Dehalococcoidia bacterium]